jgi:hypothetical protein
MQDTTLEQNTKQYFDENGDPLPDKDFYIGKDPYNIGSEKELNEDNVWLRHLQGKEDNIPLAVKNQPKKKKNLQVSEAQIRALSLGREELNNG